MAPRKAIVIISWSYCSQLFENQGFENGPMSVRVFKAMTGVMCTEGVKIFSYKFWLLTLSKDVSSPLWDAIGIIRHTRYTVHVLMTLDAEDPWFRLNSDFNGLSNLDFFLSFFHWISELLNLIGDSP